MPELREAFERVVWSSGFILGAEVEAFEAEFAAYCGVRHCVGVASGTAALEIALAGAGIGRGTRSSCLGHTFIASALGVLHAGATPVFADVEDATGLLDPRSAADVITPRTAAILPVHLYGQSCDMHRVNELARRHGLFVLEDAAQAHGATPSRPAGRVLGPTRRVSRSTRARTSARSATAARSAPTTPRSPRGRTSCGISASAARASTWRSASTSVSTACRPPSCVQNCCTSTNGTRRAVDARGRLPGGARLGTSRCSSPSALDPGLRITLLTGPSASGTRSRPPAGRRGDRHRGPLRPRGPSSSGLRRSPCSVPSDAATGRRRLGDRGALAADVRRAHPQRG